MLLIKTCALIRTCGKQILANDYKYEIFARYLILVQLIKIIKPQFNQDYIQSWSELMFSFFLMEFELVGK